VVLRAQHVAVCGQRDGGCVRGIAGASGHSAARWPGRWQRQAGEVAAAAAAGLPGAGPQMSASAVRAGVGEQHLAAGAGEGPRDPPGQHPPATVGGQAARAVPGADRLAPPARRPGQAGRRGGGSGQAGALVAGEGHAGQGGGRNAADVAERGQGGLIEVVEPQLVLVIVFGGEALPVQPGQGEHVADGDVQQVGVGFQPAVEGLAGQGRQADRDDGHRGITQRRPWSRTRHCGRPGRRDGR
jgi:hypothetical protein